MGAHHFVYGPKKISSHLEAARKHALLLFKIKKIPVALMKKSRSCKKTLIYKIIENFPNKHTASSVR